MLTIELRGTNKYAQNYSGVLHNFGGGWGVQESLSRREPLVIQLERLITVNRYVDHSGVMIDSRVGRHQTHCACAVMLSLLKYQS